MATRHQPVVRACRLDSAPVHEVLGLIGEERRAWKRTLHWDPAELSEALELAASARLLTGVAVVEGRRLVGYLSATLSADCLRPCGLWIRPSAPAETPGMLVHALLSLPEAQARRLEAQLTAFDRQDALDEAFAAEGKRVSPREWLVASLESPGGPTPLADRDGPQAGPRLRPWSAEDLRACAGLLVQAHAGGTEALINASFRDETAAAGYLRDVLRGPGCGRLLPWASSVALLHGRAVGFCLVTTVSAGVAHVPQVAVAPEAQGRGVGEALLRRARACARAEGCRLWTLSVSVENERARSWYLARGFRRLARLSAYWS